MTIACRFGGVKRSYIECLLATFEEKRISSNNSKHTVHISHPTTIRIDFSGLNKGSNGHHYSNANTIYCGHKSHSELTVLSARVARQHFSVKLEIRIQIFGDIKVF